jgi:hypothetical protein
MFRTIGFAFALVVVIAMPALAADDAALAPIHQFADGMNAGDMKKAAGAYAPSPSIIDEFPPHHWSSFASWLRDAGASFKAQGITDLRIVYGAVGDTVIGAKQAYAVVPTTLTYKVKGKPTAEKGIFTFALAKDAAGWKIAAWAWTTL